MNKCIKSWLSLWNNNNTRTKASVPRGNLMPIYDRFTWLLHDSYFMRSFHIHLRSKSGNRRGVYKKYENVCDCMCVCVSANEWNVPAIIKSAEVKNSISRWICTLVLCEPIPILVTRYFCTLWKFISPIHLNHANEYVCAYHEIHGRTFFHSLILPFPYRFI